ncbi:hypothetical protein IQ06DRAFT_137958 [Phaeosphaeriaceae sp. SRC1lsM3a]|nr:hypothetical protein IQ06DRAFT_137958 [Stagonospora sp. SRC1lsM3a]
MPLRILPRLKGRPRKDAMADFSQPHPYPPRKWHTEHERVDSANNWKPYDFKICRVNWKNLDDLTPYLTQTQVASDLGSWQQIFQLQFSHLLPDEPSIAVFSESQTPPGPLISQYRPSRYRCRLNLRYRWRKKNLRFQALDPVKVIVGSRWQYELSMKSVRHWDSTMRILLVDWTELFEEYFELEGKPRNKRRVQEIVRRFRKLEQRTLTMETGAMWSSYGDWDLQQPTAADVALACRYEGQGFEDGLSPLKRRLTAHELSVRLRNLVLVLRDSISKHVAMRR